VLPDVLQVIFTTACELVTPKHVVPGTLKILQGQLQFTGDLLPEDGLSNSPQEGPVTKAKVNNLRMAHEQAFIFACQVPQEWPVCVMFSHCLTVATRLYHRAYCTSGSLLDLIDSCLPMMCWLWQAMSDCACLTATSRLTAVNLAADISLCKEHQV